MPPELRDGVADWLVRVRADPLAAETLLAVPPRELTDEEIEEIVRMTGG